jgi:transketolase
MNKDEICFLKKKANKIRKLTVKEIALVGVGHIGGCLSVIDALTVLYYRHMRINPTQPHLMGRDRFVMSKGHAGPAVYAVLADLGYFPMKELCTLNAQGTNLPSHCDMLRTPGIDMTAGSLGQGLSCAVGMAKASKIRNDHAFIYAMIGDGESQEGQIWEASMLAAHLKLDNLIVFLDYNKLQIDGPVQEINGIAPADDKWKAFGWHVVIVEDGNDVCQIDEALTLAKTLTEKPIMIILNTIKGKGVSLVESKGAGNHNMPFGESDRDLAIKELDLECEANV